MDRSHLSQDEVHAWLAFTEKKNDEALREMRDVADTQDKVGKQEVDIPAREMLADMLLETKRPAEALVEYQQALKLSPNRFNGLYGAGMAMETAGEPAAARRFYTALLQSTDDGARSTRPEIAHAKAFVSTAALGKD